MKMIVLVMLIVGTALVHAQNQTPPTSQQAAASLQGWKVGDSLGTLTTSDGTTYNGAKLTGVEPDGISILYADGGAKIPFAQLSPELQKKFGYDPQQAAFYAREQQYLAKIDQLQQENAKLRAFIANYEATRTPQIGVEAFHCFLYHMVNPGHINPKGNLIDGPYAGMRPSTAERAARGDWEKLSDDQKMAYEKEAQFYGDPIANKEAPEAQQPEVKPQGQSQGQSWAPTPPLTTTAIDPQTGEVMIINH